MATSARCDWCRDVWTSAAPHLVAQRRVPPTRARACARCLYCHHGNATTPGCYANPHVVQCWATRGGRQTMLLSWKYGERWAEA